MRRFLLIVTLVLAGCGRGTTTEPLTTSPSGQAIVAGHVLLQNQAPGKDVVVTLEKVDANGLTVTVQRAVARMKDARQIQAGDVRADVADARGFFAFEDVPEGSYVLSASTHDYQGGSRTLSVPATTTADTTLVDIQLTPTGTFYGTLTLENATSDAGAIAYIAGTSYMAVTDATGGWVMTGVPVGSHTITGMHPDYLSRTAPGTLVNAGDSVGVASIELPLDRNIAPVATATADTGVCASTAVGLHGSGTDLDGTISLYEWDFEDDGVTDYASPSTGNTTHLYAGGPHRARFTVRDDDGGIGVTVVDFNVHAADSLYVWFGGSPSGTGTKANPYNSLQNAILVATSSPCSPTVIVSTGTYSGLTFNNGVNVSGGFDPVTWVRSPGQYTTVNVSVGGATASGISAPTKITGLDIQSVNAIAPGGNSVALSVTGSTSNLQFVDCRFRAGNGGNGTTGGPGIPGGNGGNGGVGANGTSGASSGGAGGTAGTAGAGPVSGTAGGLGGQGGYDGGGSPGGTISSSCGGSAGAGGVGGPGSPGCFTLATAGGAGQNGCNGVSGANGPAGTVGTAAASVWVPGAGVAGTAGTPGTGGGGGGGGGGGRNTICVGDRGGGGGGGGGGGAAGSGGGAGGGGGASFAVYVRNSPVVFDQCSFQTGAGGAGGGGGHGGAAGTGGSRGNGGSGADDAAGGGLGGNGGNGGPGGGGSGGPGGWSIGVAYFGPAPTVTSSIFTLGLPGLGGSGGRIGGTGTQAASGTNGTGGNTISLP